VSAEELREPPATLAATVLVVDEILVRLVVCEYLRDCGYRVVEASHAEEALTVLRQGELRIDVVLAAAESAAAIDGFELARWLRRSRPEIEVLLVGSLERTAQAAGYLCEEGPDLRKPYEPRLVAARIRRLIAERESRIRD
jgi:CheY-like chemotaxis protein